ncbi:helix-turn-helix transcriptional regulator [Streptomyces sp. NPDC093108]|uniref:helix-turn-helix domain-containing protein n=1 Tax=Streptomyces sp. NPDC093108 TaxID=3366030 RepID=UPI003804E08F
MSVPARPVRTGAVSVEPSARTPPVHLTAREARVLQCTADGMNRRDTASEIGVSRSAVSSHLTRLRRKLGVETSSLRPLLCAAYTRRLLISPVRSRAAAQDLPHVVAVWSHLGADVEDDDLAPHIEGRLQLARGGVSVQEVLDDLRRGGVGWSGVIRTGFQRGYLPGPGHRRGEPAPDRDRSGAPEHGNPLRDRATAAGRDGVPGGGPLSPLPSRGFGDHGASGLEDAAGRCVIGEHAQALRVGTDVCRDVLQRVPENRWGPVLRDAEGKVWVLFLPPRAVNGRWRAGGGHLVREGFVYRLPLPGAPGPQSWAVAPAGRFWDVRELISVIGGSRALALSDLSPAADALSFGEFA